MSSQKDSTMMNEAHGLRGTEEKPKNIDLIDLTDFDVQIALTKDEGVQIYEVLKIVTEFMIESFQSCMANDGNTAKFDTIILLERSRRLQIAEVERQLGTDAEANGQATFGELFTAEFKGASLFARNSNQTPVQPLMVEYCQRQSFLQDDVLLEKLQTSAGVGLGDKVVDVRAYINPNTRTKTSDSSSDSLEIVIIIAIVIACVAFLFLVFAIFWAWRYDKKNRDAYLTSNKVASDVRTFEGSPSSKAKSPTSKEEQEANIPSYPSVIGGDSVADGGVYPESVISEDINSSLTQYYQSGLQNYTKTGGRLQDAGSVSSMESYGYSLDGYAPSLATPMPADGASTAMSIGPAASTAETSVTKESRKIEP